MKKIRKARSNGLKQRRSRHLKFFAAFIVVVLIFVSINVMAMAGNAIFGNHDCYCPDGEPCECETSIFDFCDECGEYIDECDCEYDFNQLHKCKFCGNMFEDECVCYYCEGCELYIIDECDCNYCFICEIYYAEECDCEEIEAVVEFDITEALILVVGTDLNKLTIIDDLLLKDVKAFDEEEECITEFIEIVNDGGLGRFWTMFCALLEPGETIPVNPDEIAALGFGERLNSELELMLNTSLSNAAMLNSTVLFTGFVTVMVPHPVTGEEHEAFLPFAVMTAEVTCFYLGCPNSSKGCGLTVDGFMQVGCAQRLSDMKNTLNGKFRLIDDIDLINPAFTNQNFAIMHHSNNDGWDPVGTTLARAFTGELDGAGYTLKNLEMRRGSSSGLFGWLSGAIIKDLTIELSPRGIIGSGERKGGLTGNACNVISCA